MQRVATVAISRQTWRGTSQMYLLIYSFENIFCFIFCSGSPEAEAGVSCVRQEVFRPETTHQAGARGTQGDQGLGVSRRVL